MNESRFPDDVRRHKQTARAERRNLTLPEKVAQVVELQRIILPQLRRRRTLKPWEKIWNLVPHHR